MGTFTKLTYHVVFSTKHRKKLICSDFRERLCQYVGGIIRNQNGHLIEIGGIEDHVHILAGLTPARSISDVVRDLKANASKWINDSQFINRRFQWQKGYAAFTVSYSHTESVAKYIRDQKQHHRAKSFEQEYVAFLKRHDIVFDSRYLFEQEHHG